MRTEDWLNGRLLERNSVLFLTPFPQKDKVVIAVGIDESTKDLIASVGDVTVICSENDPRVVAIPTAIPEEPFTRRFGTLVGMTSGSFRLSS